MSERKKFDTQPLPIGIKTETLGAVAARPTSERAEARPVSYAAVPIKESASATSERNDVIRLEGPLLESMQRFSKLMDAFKTDAKKISRQGIDTKYIQPLTEMGVELVMQTLIHMPEYADTYAALQQAAKSSSKEEGAQTFPFDVTEEILNHFLDGGVSVGNERVQRFKDLGYPIIKQRVVDRLSQFEELEN